jgi:3-deoxy-7-phosphoheptulonate synthase
MTPIPSPKELKSLFPLSANTASQIDSHRHSIEKLLSGEDSRFCIILGPCSLHDLDSAIEYAQRVRNLQKKVENTCFLVMRAYIEKPRTFLGWKGLLYDPYLNGEENLLEGLSFSRDLLLKLSNIGTPLATEFLDPLASLYFSDLISWGFIGARTSSSQTHRQLASLLPMPVGFKNSIDGNLESAVHGASLAKKPHKFLHVSENGQLMETETLGNAATHVVLRGSTRESNYDASWVKKALDLSLACNLHSRILIDCSHGNSQKDYTKQGDVFFSILEQHLEGNPQILGAMIESHLEEGSQSFCSEYMNPSVSITDSCLGWSRSEELVLSAAEALSSSCLLRTSS